MKNCIFSALLAIISTPLLSQVTVLSEDFENGIPSNWTIVNNDQLTPVDPLYTDAWVALPDPENSEDTVASSTSFFSPTGTASRWLITPPLSLGAYGNWISWKAKSHDASFPDNSLVLVSTTGLQLSDFTDTIRYIVGESFEWVEREVDLSSKGYANQSIYLAFVNNTTDGFKYYLDSVKVWKEDPVNLNELATIELKLYPNPVINLLTIQSAQPINSICIRNSNGQIVLQGKGNQMNVEALAAGFYYAEVEINQFKIIKSFVKSTQY